MKTKHAARKIHARAPWVAHPEAYSAPQRPQQSVQQPAPQPSAPHTAPNRPQDARTMREALAGLQAAGATAHIKLVTPRFRSTAGPWIRMGEHDIRIPPDVIIRTVATRDGTAVIGVLAYLDSSPQAGRVQVLVTRPRGIVEMVGLMPEQLRQLREVFLGR